MPSTPRSPHVGVVHNNTKNTNKIGHVSFRAPKNAPVCVVTAQNCEGYQDGQYPSDKHTSSKTSTTSKKVDLQPTRSSDKTNEEIKDPDGKSPMNIKNSEGGNIDCCRYELTLLKSYA